MKTTTVFLGGTCNNSIWRDELVPKLNSSVDAFNPVTPNWDEEFQKLENKHKAEDDVCLYVFTPESLNSPQRGLYSIAEVANDSAKRAEKVVFAYIPYGGQTFTEGEVKGLKAVANLVKANGGTVLTTLDEVATHLNNI